MPSRAAEGLPASRAERTLAVVWALVNKQSVFSLVVMSWSALASAFALSCQAQLTDAEAAALADRILPFVRVDALDVIGAELAVGRGVLAQGKQIMDCRLAHGPRPQSWNRLRTLE